jgi:precorrin-6Y C5,15-methyltransferase (decarboxylating)
MPPVMPADLPVAVVGVVGGEVFGAAARQALDHADVVLGSPRHLAQLGPDEHRERIPLTGDLALAVEVVGRRRAEGRRTCVLASGDPGFFGIVRVLAARFGSAALQVHPAPSSVSLAFAAAGLPWDDAAVISAHGRPVTNAVETALRQPKVAVLTAPANPPEVLGQRLLDAGCGLRRVVVASRLGEEDAQVVTTDLAGLAGGSFDPMSVVILLVPDVAADGPTLSWGRHEDQFAHRAGMVTKAEVRAVVLGKLELPRAGVLWDVGAGSGSVGIEAATVSPGLRVYAVERNGEDAARLRTNAERAGVAAQLDIIAGGAPDALADLPDPDRVFVGGGGLDVVQAAWSRLRPGGVLVATFVLLDRAVAALGLLGELVQIHVDRAVPVGEVGVRLEPTNPVFVARGVR